MRGYIGLITVDVTQSACIAVEAKNKNDARTAMLTIARSHGASRLFDLDEGNMEQPYFGDPDNIIEIDNETLRNTQRSMALRLGAVVDESEQDLRARLLLNILAARLDAAKRLFHGGQTIAAMNAVFGCHGLNDLEAHPTASLLILSQQEHCQ